MVQNFLCFYYGIHWMEPLLLKVTSSHKTHTGECKFIHQMAISLRDYIQNTLLPPIYERNLLQSEDLSVILEKGRRNLSSPLFQCNQYHPQCITIILQYCTFWISGEEGKHWQEASYQLHRIVNQQLISNSPTRLFGLILICSQSANLMRMK